MSIDVTEFRPASRALSVVELAETAGTPRAAILRLLEIDESTIRKWRDNPAIMVRNATARRVRRLALRLNGSAGGTRRGK